MPQTLETLSEQFDSGKLNPESLTSSELQQIEEWKRLGDCLRQIPVRKFTGKSEAAKQPMLQQGRSVSKQTHSAKRISVLVSTIALCFVVLMTSLVVHETADWWVQTNPLAPLDLSDKWNDYELVLMELPPSNANPHDAVLSTLENEGVVNRSPLQNLSSTATLIEARISANELESLLSSDGIRTETNEGGLLGRFVESLQTPSRSELYFDDVVIVLPQEVLDRVHRNDLQSPGKLRPKIYVVTRAMNDECQPLEASPAKTGETKA